MTEARTAAPHTVPDLGANPTLLLNSGAAPVVRGGQGTLISILQVLCEGGRLNQLPRMWIYFVNQACIHALLPALRLFCKRGSHSCCSCFSYLMPSSHVAPVLWRVYSTVPHGVPTTCFKSDAQQLSVLYPFYEADLSSICFVWRWFVIAAANTLPEGSLLVVGELALQLPIFYVR